MLIHKDLILKVIDVVEKINQSSIIEIIKDGESNKYQFKISEWSDNNFELVCLTDEDTIWNDYDSFNDMKEDLICNAVRGRFQDINICL